MAFSFDDAWDNGPEVTRAGTAAFGLYCRCGAWVARNLTDGFVPSQIAAAYGTPEWAAKLVAASLWETVEGGYHMPHYLDRNPSAEKVRQRRKADAERKARSRSKDRTSRRDSQQSPNRSHNRNPRPPYPTPNGVAAGARANARGAARPPEAVPTELRHPYEPTEIGDCAQCGLPATNRRH